MAGNIAGPVKKEATVGKPFTIEGKIEGVGE